ncbi:GATA type transcriptional activator of nitrogen-regulated proteins [Coemansia erecta]|nr:GATA type transcriptional activator of nitrogen-regulated proteins [Coemansia erecta]
MSTLQLQVHTHKTPELKTGDSPVCFNCHVDTTPLWRRDTMGNVICNACGLYFKLHSVARPISMKRAVIKRRRRRATNSTAPNGKQRTRVGPAAVRSSSVPLDEECSSPEPAGGLESLMRAAELSPPISRKRAHLSLLDSLATVATAEISLSKRRALGIHCNTFAPLDTPYREALQRECERLCMEAALAAPLNIK